MLEAWAVAVAFPVKNSPFGACTSRLGKPCVNWTLAGDQYGAFSIIKFSNVILIIIRMVIIIVIIITNNYYYNCCYIVYVEDIT